MDSKTIRHQNLLRLFGRYRTQKDFAEALDVSAQRIGHLINATKAIGDATARQLEQLHGLPPGWMDVPHGAEDAATPYAPLPLSDDQRRLLADYNQMTPAYRRWRARRWRRSWRWNSRAWRRGLRCISRNPEWDRRAVPGAGEGDAYCCHSPSS